MKKMISITLLFYSFSVFAQTAEVKGQDKGQTGIVPAQDSRGGSASGSASGSGSGAGTGVGVQGAPAAPQMQCEFNPPMSDTDRTLLNNVKNLITQLRSDPNCALPADAPLTTLTDAISAFDIYSGTGRDTPGSPNGSIPLNCVTYESDIDRRFDQFVRNVGESRYHFRECSQTDRQAAIECAMNIVARQKSETAQRCADWSVARTNSARIEAGTRGYQDIVGILTQMINSRDCGNRDELTRQNLLNLGLSVAGRAASFVPVGAAQVAIAGITQLAQVAVRAIAGNRENDINRPDVRQRKIENFRNLACTYRVLENRARNCERYIADENVISSRDQYAADLVTCDIDPTQTTSSLDFLSQFDSIASALRAPADGADAASQPARAQPETEDRILDFINSLNETTFPGTDRTFVDVGIENANRVNEYHQRIMNDDTFAAEALRATGATQTSGSRIEQFRRGLRQEREDAQKLTQILTQFKAKYDNPAELAGLQQLMANFGGNFRLSFANILTRGAALSGNLGDQIDAQNGSVEVLAAFGRIEAHRAWRQQAERQDLHASDFRNQLAIMQPEIRSATNDFLNISQNGLRNYTSANINDPNTKQRIIDEQIQPAILACNNLRSAMVEFPRRPGATFNAGQEHSICSKFNCQPSGIKTFADHLRAKNLNQNISQCNMGDCLTEYERYVCRASENTQEATNALVDEFRNTGRICGKTIEQLASSR